MAVLKIAGPDGNIREVILPQGETTVGRDPSNTMVLEGRGVSRVHAKFLVDSQTVEVVDLGSTYGTRVNDVPTMKRELIHGDCLTVGMHQITVCIDEDPFDFSDAGTEKGLGFSEDLTLDPSMHERATLQIDRSAIQFVLDNPDESGQAVKVLSKGKSDLMQAVERLESATSSVSETVRTPTAEMQKPADYQALMLMYRVSAQLAVATDLDSFLAPVADMVMEEVSSNTVVVLLLNEQGELIPRVIRHRGALHPGEVPVSRGILDLLLRERKTVVSNDVGHDDRINAGHSLSLYNIRSVAAAPLLVRGEVTGALYLNRAGPVAFNNSDGDLIASIALLLASGIEQSKLKERVNHENQRRKALERFHPPEVVSRLFKSGDKAGELDEHRATAMVCDIVGFSGLIGRLEPHSVGRILHEYYETVYEKIFGNGGSLVKLHDGWLLALFGAQPGSTDRDAVWAVEAAIALCEEFNSLARLWPHGNSLHLGCALDTGPVLAGFVGSVDRLEYAALGMPISNSTTIARQAKQTAVFITERTWNELPQKRYNTEDVPYLPNEKVLRLAERERRNAVKPRADS